MNEPDFTTAGGVRLQSDRFARQGWTMVTENQTGFVNVPMS
jgi:hypothetical protein